MRPIYPIPRVVYPLKWTDPRFGVFSVYPTAHNNTLNYGLDKRHILAGTFVTAESLAVRQRNKTKPPFAEDRPDNPYDKLSVFDDPARRNGSPIASGGLQLAGCNVVEYPAGTQLYRFGAEKGYEGGWWSDRTALMRMLLRVEPGRPGSRGVVNGSRYNIRDYAQRYSEVLTYWADGGNPGQNRSDASNLRYLWATRLMAPVRVLRGMGAAQRNHAAEQAGDRGFITYESATDDNVQIFIPNIFGRIGATKPGEPSFFQQPVRWLPEVLEANLVPQIEAKLAAGESLRTILEQVDRYMITGNRRMMLDGTQPT